MRFIAGCELVSFADLQGEARVVMKMGRFVFSGWNFMNIDIKQLGVQGLNRLYS